MVKRLEWESCDVHNCHCDIVESKDGDMVNYEDYASLESEHKSAMLTLDKISELLGTSDTLSVSEQVAALQLQVVNLAVESASLKSGAKKAIEDIQCFYDSNGWEVSEDGESDTPVVSVEDAKGSIEHFVLTIKTPATDAAIATIQAQGVEAFASHLRANDSGASVCKMIALGADDFAAQLRKGASND